MARSVQRVKTNEFLESGTRSITLRCPRCGEELGLLPEARSKWPQRYRCSACHFAMDIEREVWKALPPERLAYYSEFLKDYQSIRAAEGRGSRNAEFYLGLPYKDATGNNSKQWKIRARTYEYLSNQLLPQLVPSRNDKYRILDLGAGNGWMSYRLATRGYYPVAVDLLINDQDGLAAAAHYQRALSSPFPCVQAEMVKLPFADRQFDAVIFNASFHYSISYERSLAEALRCTRVGGSVIIADTPWYSSEAAGNKMIEERHWAYKARYGTASNSLPSLEFLTDQRLQELAQRLDIRWRIDVPDYGLRWTLRPLIAKLNGRREPSRFQIYSAGKTA